MRRLFPDSLAGRTVLLLLVGLVASHMASFAIYANDHFGALSKVFGHQIAERVTAIAELMNATPSEGRPKLVRAFQSTTLQLKWEPESALPADPSPDEVSQTVHEALMRRLKNWDPEAVRVNYRKDALSAGRLRYVAEGFYIVRLLGIADTTVARVKELSLSVRLNDGTWINFTAPLERFGILHDLRFLVSNLLMIASLVAGAIWLLRLITKPLATFARAAERLGRDVNAPPLVEGGPWEVRKGVRAFNVMQERLRRFVADRTQMLAAISHDLRTPLTRLRLRAEFMEDDQQRAKVLSDLDEMEAMLLSTLSFARDDAAAEAVEEVDLKSAVADLCADMADAGQPVEFAGGQMRLCQCRPRALRRALGNFIDNAVKYAGNARVRVLGDGRDAVIEVEDDGPGIPEEEHEKVFAPFYRLEPSRNRDTGGVGLGLAVARNIVHAHGGEVALANRIEGGLRVTVRLPC